MISLHDITKYYGRGVQATAALRGISLEIAQGEFVAIMGKSGCGKSTLLNLLGCMDTPTRGTYHFDGQEISAWDARRMAAFRNQSLGFVFQAFHLLPELNVMQNVALSLGYAGQTAQQRKSRALELLSMVGLANRGRARVHELSGGEQQRVAVARALANQPRLILADEPTGNLDEETGRNIMELLKVIHKDGTTIVMVTHDAALANETQRVIHIANGSVV